MIQNETKNHRNKKSLSELWEAFRQLNISLIGVPDRVVLAEKNIWKGQIFVKFEKYRPPIDPEGAMSSEREKDEDICTRHIIIKLLKTSDKENS